LRIDTIDTSRVLPFAEHIRQAAALANDKVEEIRTLAAQLKGQPVLPVIGAGASYDCGMRLATEIGQQLHDLYHADSSFNHVQGLEPTLGDVAQAIHIELGQAAAVRAIGLDDPRLWPGKEEVTEHFCNYRILARFARETPIAQAISFNYDCGTEAALQSEGFRWGPITPGLEWSDHARVVADSQTHHTLDVSRSFTLLKGHGCAERYRELASDDEERAANTIVICSDQLLDWDGRPWIRDAFRGAARTNVLLLLGFSGQDPVIYNEIQRVLADVYRDLPAPEVPRVVAIDQKPDTVRLRGLVRAGFGDQPVPDGFESQIETGDTTTTAVLTLLLAEAIALRLDADLTAHGVTLTDEVNPRLAALIISGPPCCAGRISFAPRPRTPSCSASTCMPPLSTGTCH
jgi:hypothetical protein